MRGIDYTDKTLYEDDGFESQPLEKEYYTPEEAYELVVSDVKNIITVVDTCHAQNMHED